MNDHPHDFPLPEEYIGDIQPLHKVFPAGEPILNAHWTCPVCGLTVRGCQPRVCLDDCNPDCPVEVL